MTSFTLENIGQWIIKILFLTILPYLFILWNFCLTDGRFFSPTAKSFVRYYIWLWLKKILCSVNIFCAHNVFGWSKERFSILAHNGRCSILHRHKKLPFDPDNRNTYKTNANPKINNLMSENIGQRRQKFSLEYFDALYYHQNIPEKIFVSFVRYFQTWGCLSSNWHLFYKKLRQCSIVRLGPTEQEKLLGQLKVDQVCFLSHTSPLHFI